MSRHTKLMHLIAAVAAALPASAVAQVQTDGSLGPARTLTGPSMTVTPDLGQQRGGNLFHSFSRLNVNAGESLTFTGPTSVQNVLARVTGGQVTNINGLLACDIPSANLYLINPAGILWGPGAQLNISGSLVMTSSDLVKFSDGGQFPAAVDSDAVLTSAPVSAFGFLGPQSAANGISVAGDLGASALAMLDAPAGKTVSLIGGPVNVTVGRVRAPGGRVNIVAAAQGAEVAGDGVDPVAAPTISGPRADVAITTVGLVATGGAESGLPAGPVAVIADGLDVSLFSNINAFNDVATAGGAINVDLTGALSITDGSQISTGAFGDGASGAITVAARSVSLANTTADEDDNFTTITSLSGTAAPTGLIRIQTGLLEIGGADSQIDSSGDGSIGGVLIEAQDVHVSGRGAFIRAQNLVNGPVGDVVLNVDSLLLSDGGQIFCRGGLFLPTPGGTVRITAADSVTITGTSSIFGNTFTPQGDQGGVRISSRDFVMRDGSFITSESFFGGIGGPIVMRAADIRLYDAARVTSSTASADTGGRIDLRGRRILLDARGGIDNGPGLPRSFATITSTASGPIAFGTFSTSGGGAGGAIIALAQESIVVAGGATIDASTITGGGAGGSVSASAPLIRADGGGQYSSNAIGSDASAGSVILKADRIEFTGFTSGARTLSVLNGMTGTSDSGDIFITTARLVMDDNASINASTRTPGQGGDITIDAVEFSITRGSVVVANSALQGTPSTGDGGSITARGRVLTIRDAESQIAASTATPGAGGAVVLEFDTISIGGEGTTPAAGQLPPGVDAQTTGTGPGGSIDILARNWLFVGTNGAITAQSTATDPGAGDAGNIRITANEAQVTDGGQIAASAAAADAGDITLDAGRSLTIQDNRPGAVAPTAQSALDDTFTGPRITARAAGDGGNIKITASDLVFLRRGLITAQTGNLGGQINIDPDVVVIDKSLIDGRSSGTPVPVSIVTDGLLLSNDSLILTDAPAFTVNTDIAGTIAAIDAKIVDATQRLIESCARRYDAESAGGLSSFIVEGRGGVPIAPGMLMPSISPTTQPAR